MRMLNYYINNIIRQDFLTKFCYKNIYELPRLEQIILTFTVSQSSLKSLLPALSALMLISSNKPCLVVSKKAYLVLRTKSGVPIGCKVNLRGAPKFLFLEKLILSIFPRMKAIKWSYGQKNLFIRLENVFLFKELEKEYEYFQDLSKLNIYLIFRAKSAGEIFAFLGALKFPIKQSN